MPGVPSSASGWFEFSENSTPGSLTAETPGLWCGRGSWIGRCCRAWAWPGRGNGCHWRRPRPARIQAAHGATQPQIVCQMRRVLAGCG